MRETIGKMIAIGLATATIMAQPVATIDVKTMDLFGEEPRVVLAQEPEPRRVQVLVGSEFITFPDTQPVIVGDRTLVPIRGVFEKLGWNVDWDGDSQTAILEANDHVIRIPIGEKQFTVNGKLSDEIDVPAQLIGGRTMLPIRAIAEASGCHVDWIDSVSTVLVSTAGNIAAKKPERTPVLTPEVLAQIAAKPTPTPTPTSTGNPYLRPKSTLADPLLELPLGEGVVIGFNEPSGYGATFKGLYGGADAMGLSQRWDEMVNYEVRWDMSETDPLWNYFIYDGEGAPTNQLRRFTQWRQLGVQHEERVNGDVIGLEFSKSFFPHRSTHKIGDSSLAEFEVGQTIIVKFFIRNIVTGEGQGYRISFEYTGKSPMATHNGANGSNIYTFEKIEVE